MNSKQLINLERWVADQAARFALVKCGLCKGSGGMNFDCVWCHGKGFSPISPNSSKVINHDKKH